MDWRDKGHIGCLLIGISYVIFCIVCCYRSEIKQKERKTISDYEKYIADSIAYEKRVKERKEEEERERLKREQEELENTYTVAIICNSDSIYHTTTKCEKLMLSNCKDFSIKDYRLSTIHDAKDKGYEICISCKGRENVLRKYEDREIVNYEDVPQIAFEDFGMIDPEDYEDDYSDWEDRDYYERY